MSEQGISRRETLLALASAASAGALVTGSAAAETPQRRVAILIYNNGEVIDFTGPHEVFGAAGWDVFTVAATPATVTLGAGLQVVPNHTFANAPQADVLVIPGGDISQPRQDQATLDWIRAQSAHTRYTMSICNGAFIFAATGLLDGLSATTTRHNLPRLQAAFPHVRVIRDQRVVANGRFITTGGLSAGIDGALYVTRQLDGAGTAESIALYLEYDAEGESHYLPGLLAINALPDLNNVWAIGDWTPLANHGDRDHWLLSSKITTSMGYAELRARIETAFGADHTWKRHAHAEGDGSSWRNLHQDGAPWAATITVTPVTGETNTWAMNIVLARAA